VITQYELSLAVAADARHISELSRDAIEYGLAWSWTPRRVLQSLDDASTNVVVARRASNLLGFGIMKYKDDEAHLLLLAVAMAQRRKGVGSAMLAWLEATLRVAGISIVRLEARAGNTAARAFYRAHGYEEAGLRERYYQGVEDAVCIVKDLRLHR
jgi:[ribosomal protein S18]-alanine N-acetyltransferase